MIQKGEAGARSAIEWRMGWRRRRRRRTRVWVVVVSYEESTAPARTTTQLLTGPVRLLLCAVYAWCAARGAACRYSRYRRRYRHRYIVGIGSWL